MGSRTDPVAACVRVGRAGAAPRVLHVAQSAEYGLGRYLDEMITRWGGAIADGIALAVHGDKTATGVLLKGVELDILPDGSLDLPDAVLEPFDIVLISIHSQLDMPKARMTRRTGSETTKMTASVNTAARIISTRSMVRTDLR